MAIQRVLVANRGEIAVRIIQACKALGIESVLATSTADRGSLAAQVADRVICIGPSRATDSYLNQNAILAAAKGSGSDAIHPGYGFLAENPSFVKACEDNGFIFIGPQSAAVAQMGNKLAARELANELKVPIVPGSARINRLQDAEKTANKIGFPVLFKAAAGGGGRGIRIVKEASELQNAFQSASAEAEAAFGDNTLYMERFIASARHIEIQVFGDKAGNALHFGERDCSMQRRYQKIIEEAPAVIVPAKTLQDMRSAAISLVKGISYQNAGTIEFIYDLKRDEFYFLEMNTRIQVEHPVTEAVTGIDLVQLQLTIAAGKELPYQQSDIKFSNHAIECRINAESAKRSFHPSPGRITKWAPPQDYNIRLDTHCFQDYVVPPFYDSLLAKLIVSGTTRSDAIDNTHNALRHFQIDGIETNLDFLTYLSSHPDFIANTHDTRWIENNLDPFLAQ